MNAYAVGGTIRATFTMASALAERHDVEIVSVIRTTKRPPLPLDPAVRLRPLVDRRKKRRRRAIEAGDGGPRARAELWALEQPSRVMSRHERRYRKFSLLTDATLLRYLATVNDGALIGTRPAINLALARFARPSVVRVGQDHMHLDQYEPEIRAEMARWYPQLDLLTALTEGTTEKFRKLLGGRTRVEAVPNGVTFPQGRPAPLEASVVASAGRMTMQKGFDRLLPVWRRVADEHPDWELRLYGSGRREADLARQIEELGLEGSARLMGHSPRLGEELRRASLYVMTSRFEGFPMVLLEAMSAGLPVVSYDIPTGPAEIVTQGVDGFVVPDGDDEALAVAIGELIADPAKRRSFGTAAMEKARRYEPDVVAQRLESLLEELAAEKERAARGPKQSLNAALSRVTGYQVVKAEKPRRNGRPKRAKPKREAAKPPKASLPDHYDEEARETIRGVRPWTMTSHEKLFALIVATRYVVDQRIPGAVVECGVWRGGSMQAVARTLLARGVSDRDLHLFDTFEGMPPPTERDRRLGGRPAAEILATRPRESNVWAIADLDDVQAGMRATGYPSERVHFHPGLVEETVPDHAPERIAVLRLDTDWYDSTKHELEHLYGRVQPGGVLLLDDYGYWEGARQAVDEFVDETGVRLLLVPMGSGRITVKP